MMIWASVRKVRRSTMPTSLTGTVSKAACCIAYVARTAAVDVPCARPSGLMLTDAQFGERDHVLDDRQTQKLNTTEGAPGEHNAGVEQRDILPGPTLLATC